MKCPDDCLSKEDYPYCTEGCRDESDFTAKCTKCGSEMENLPTGFYPTGRIWKCPKCGHEEGLSQ